MPEDWEESEETEDVVEAHREDLGLSPEGIASMQGLDVSQAIDMQSETRDIEDDGTRPAGAGRDAATPAAPPTDASETYVVGDPEGDARFCHEQQRQDTCAIAAHRGIIEIHTGEDPGEDALEQESLENRWYTREGGTYTSDVGNLLESHGIPVTKWEDAGMDTLQNELSQGHDVIVGVEAGYLSQDGDGRDGHALWVTGLEMDETGEVVNVFVNDSGNPDLDGGGWVPADVFQAAWARGGNLMISTQRSAVERG